MMIMMIKMNKTIDKL